MTRRGRLLAALILVSLVSATWSGVVYAKSVRIEWKPIPGATEYELQVMSGAQTVFSKKQEDTVWTGELPFGMFTYQLRALDKIKRPGKWTVARALVVTPPAPKATFPAEGKKVEMFSPTASTTLKWAPIEGVQKYSVELRRDGKPIQNVIVEGTQLPIKALPPGNYSWKVHGVLAGSTGRGPASVPRTWQGQASAVEEFKVEHKALDRVTPEAPLGSQPPADDGKLRFKWKRVDGAEAYEVQVVQARRTTPGRAIASAFEKAKKYITEDNAIELRVPHEGHYYWKVRALANIDEKRVAQATGPESTTRFDLDRNAVFKDDAGYIALSTTMAPYVFRSSVPGQGDAPVRSSSLTGRLSAEYWIKPQFGLGLAYEHTAFFLNGTMLARKTFELTGKYRMKFNTDKYGWSISPKISIEGRDYVILYMTDLTNPFAFSADPVMTFGPSIGLDVRKQFTDKLSVGFKAAYFYPLLTLPSANGQNTLVSTHGMSVRNVSAGLQGLYWLSPNWGLGAGAYGEFRSAAYTNSVSPTVPIEVQMDGLYFFTSLVYRFWR